MTSSTDPENWNQVKEIFGEARQYGPEERGSFLDRVCGDDENLRRDVESLLSSSDAAKGFMESPAIGEVANEVAAAGEDFHNGRILDHYRLIRLLGEGGMGQVYLAQDTRLDREVALKILPAAFARDADLMRRFVQEAKAASALNHPNILTIYETGEFEDTNYIASEYIEGKTLTELLRSGPLSLKSALDIAIQVASALQKAHEAGIVHRDIKPDNVMIRPDGLAKVLDFGVAKLIDKNIESRDAEAATAIQTGTTPGMIIGTANYMSPEQARGRSVDARSDIFSFGLVLYEMLTGKKAFAGESAIDVIASILHKEPEPLHIVAPDLPNDLERIVRKALRKEREERYQTAKDLLIDLKDAQQDVDLKKRLEHGSPENARRSAVAIDAATSISPQQLTTEGPSFKQKGWHRGWTVLTLAVLVLIFAGAGYWYLSGKWFGNARVISSIAVLPFVNESGSADTEYLSDGMTETLISSLSQLPNLDIKARSSVFRYKGTNTDLHQIAKELNVQAILSGRLLIRNSDLSLYVELVDISTDKVIWSQTYRNQMADLVALQNEIARDVASNLRSKLSLEQPVVKNHTEDAETYQLYLRGRYEWNKHTQEDLQKAIGYYEQALEKDPNYALAYAGLSGCYGVLANGYLRPAEAFPKAKLYAQKALSVDDSLSESHTAMAAVDLYFDWDWAEADKHLQRALSIKPNDPDAHLLRSDLLLAFKRFDEARAEVKRAQEIDPLSRIFNSIVGANYYTARQYDEAIPELEKTIDLDLGFSEAYLYLGQAYEQKQMYDRAIATFQKGMEQTDQSPQLVASRGHTYALAGERVKALKTVDELKEMSAHQYVSPYAFAVVYAGLGDKDQCFDWLERAHNDRTVYLLWINSEPQFDPVRNDPRFSDLVDRMGLPN